MAYFPAQWKVPVCTGRVTIYDRFYSSLPFITLIIFYFQLGIKRRLTVLIVHICFHCTYSNVPVHFVWVLTKAFWIISFALTSEVYNTLNSPQYWQSQHYVSCAVYSQPTSWQSNCHRRLMTLITFQFFRWRRNRPSCCSSFHCFKISFKWNTDALGYL